MPIDGMLGRRKPFTSGKALVYILALVGSAATIALPVVLILANNSIRNQREQLSAKDQEIERLKSENQKAIPRLAVLPSRVQNPRGPQPERDQGTGARQRADGRQPGRGAEQVFAKQLGTPAAMKNLPSDAQEVHVAKVEADMPGGNGPDAFENKLARLHERVVGTARRPLAGSEDFESRLAGLHAKVVRQGNTKPDVDAE